MKQLLKKLIVPKGRKLRKIRGGVAKGMLMDLDLSHQSQRYWGFDEREIAEAVLKLMAPCKSIVDVGANDGYYTMAFLRSSAERVIACEPSPVADLLLRNAAANGYHPDDRFSVISKPVGLEAGYISVSELLRDLPTPVFMKVDIDGGEFDLLESAKDYPFLAETYWLIETHSSELEEQCIAWLRDRSHHNQIIYNARWRVLLPELRPIPHNRWFTSVPIEPYKELIA